MKSPRRNSSAIGCFFSKLQNHRLYLAAKQTRRLSEDTDAFLFTKSNYKHEWPRLAPVACVFIHQPRVKCCRCDVVFTCLFNAETWPPGSDLTALPIPWNCDGNIVMINCQVNLNWPQNVDFQKKLNESWMLWHECCDCDLALQHCPDCHSFIYSAQILTMQSLESLSQSLSSWGMLHRNSSGNKKTRL